MAATDGSSSFDPLRILIAAGGTGGHVYPGLALGEQLAEARPDVRLLYCCGNRPGELAIYRAAGIEPLALPISGRRRGVGNAFRFVREFAAASRLARREIARFAPRVAVGFGGYASVPALRAARRAGAVTALHEQNARPGWANRWLARRAAVVFAGMEIEPGALPSEKVELVGNPIRRDLLRPADRGEERRELGLPAAGAVALAFGGSLGARGVNRLIIATLERVARGRAEEPFWHFLIATGEAQYEAVRDAIARIPGAGARATAIPYLHRMDRAYAAADLVVSRAGALTLAEIAALGKPSILVPLPTAAAGHQMSNARNLERAGAARIVDETVPDAAERMWRHLAELFADARERERMARAARTLARPDAARAMADRVLELAGIKGRS